MDAIDYVEMLSALDRQVAGLEDMLARPNLPEATRQITTKAAARWKAVRAIVARQNQPAPLIAPQLAALRTMVKAIGLGLEILGGDHDTAAVFAKALRAVRDNFDEEVFQP